MYSSKWLRKASEIIIDLIFIIWESVLSRCKTIQLVLVWNSNTVRNLEFEICEDATPSWLTCCMGCRKSGQAQQDQQQGIQLQPQQAPQQAPEQAPLPPPGDPLAATVFPERGNIHATSPPLLLTKPVQQLKTASQASRCPMLPTIQSWTWINLAASCGRGWLDCVPWAHWGPLGAKSYKVSCCKSAL